MEIPTAKRLLATDKHISFKRHTENLCPNVNYKLNTLRRIRKRLTVEKAKLLGNAFIDSQLNYAPLICTFCQKTPYLRSKGYTK